MSQRDTSKSDSVSPASANPKRERLTEQTVVLGVHVWPIEIPKGDNNYEWTMKCCIIRRRENGMSTLEPPDYFQENILLAKQKYPRDSFESFNSTHNAKKIIEKFKPKFPKCDKISDIVVVHCNMPCDGQYIARSLANHIHDTRGYTPRHIGITEWDFFQNQQLAHVREYSAVLRESPYGYLHPLHAQLSSEPDTNLIRARYMIEEELRKCLATINDANDINPSEITILVVGTPNEQVLQEFKNLPICKKLADRNFVIKWKRQADQVVREKVEYAAAVHALHLGVFTIED